MIEALLIAGYLLAVAGLGWVESKLLMALKLGSRWGGLAYAIIADLLCAVIAPIGVIASVAAGFIGVMGAINNTKGVTAQDAFGSWAGPVAIIALGMIAVVRILPLFLMNLKSPLKALVYAVVSTAVLSILLTISGIIFISILPSSTPTSTTTPSTSPAPASP